MTNGQSHPLEKPPSGRLFLACRTFAFPAVPVHVPRNPEDPMAILDMKTASLNTPSPEICSLFVRRMLYGTFISRLLSTAPPESTTEKEFIADKARQKRRG